MFTWVCPRCGREIDVAEDECPHCPPEPKEEQTSESEAAPAAAPRPARKEAQPEPPPFEAAPPAVEAEPAPAPHTPHAFTLSTTQLLLVLVAFVAAIVVAVFVARPDLLDGGAAAGQETAGSSLNGLEVAGLRVWRSDDNDLLVRLLVVNHTGETQQDVGLTIKLRDAGAGPEAAPLASFNVDLREDIEPWGSQEVETRAEIPAGLGPLPDWQNVRAAVLRY